MINQSANEPLRGPGDQNNVLTQIHRGMKVFDRDNKEIGTVDQVYMGEADLDADARGLGPTTARGSEPASDALVQDLGRFFSSGEIPDELRERLLRQGFVRIDSSGLLASDRFAMPEQIASVTNDRVMLKVTRAELIKK
jgi:hypothetical protein